MKIMPLSKLKLHQDKNFPEVVCEPSGGSLGEFSPGYPESGLVGTDLARRAVACWNACIGIPTETLESMGRAESVADLQQRCAAIRGELRTELHKEAP